jgi:hypothetical protein
MLEKKRILLLSVDKSLGFVTVKPSSQNPRVFPCDVNRHIEQGAWEASLECQAELPYSARSVAFKRPVVRAS